MLGTGIEPRTSGIYKSIAEGARDLLYPISCYPMRMLHFPPKRGLENWWFLGTPNRGGWLNTARIEWFEVLDAGKGSQFSKSMILKVHILLSQFSLEMIYHPDILNRTEDSIGCLRRRVSQSLSATPTKPLTVPQNPWRAYCGIKYKSPFALVLWISTCIWATFNNFMLLFR